MLLWAVTTQGRETKMAPVGSSLPATLTLLLTCIYYWRALSVSSAVGPLSKVCTSSEVAAMHFTRAARDYIHLMFVQGYKSKEKKSTFRNWEFQISTPYAKNVQWDIYLHWTILRANFFDPIQSDLNTSLLFHYWLKQEHKLSVKSLWRLRCFNSFSSPPAFRNELVHFRDI